MRACLLSFVALVGTSAWADSPLTSIDFTEAYLDLPVVRALKDGASPDTAYAFLLSDAPNDQKLAVLTALGWGHRLGPGLVDALAQRRERDPQRVDLASLSPSEKFAVGFLAALDDPDGLGPLAPKGGPVWTAKPVALLEAAARALPDDFAVQYALALVRAQAVMAKDWCQVFQLPKAVERRFAEGARNLRPGALERAQGYLAGYEESCPGSAAAARKAKEALNESYGVALLGAQVVNGTQGGVVVWEAGRREPVHVEPGFICKVLRFGSSVFAGCEKEVLRWDGTTMHHGLLRADGQGPAEYYEPLPGPQGALWVRRGARLWRYVAATDTFVEEPAPWAEPTLLSDVLGLPTGDVFWVRFMESIHTRTRRWPKGSAGYAGLDPRSLARTEDGTLWALDFASGFFRYLPDKEAWVKEPGVADKASAVAVDVQRKRTWLLHYTRGLVLKDGRGGEPATLGFPDLQYLRALALAPDGSVWVGAIGALVHVTRVGDGWKQERLLVR